jgi:glycosyltransferase involved in cell wall biosynthesis
MKRVLLVAFQYPPMTGTSGIQRALRFSQYLPEFGWEPIVLAAHPRAYDRTSTDQMNDVPKSIHVARPFALDCARHLSLFGRYPRAWAIPDRWASWRFWAVPAGRRLIRRLRPCAIWSTFPIPTAHRIGLALHERSGLPWVADFRDVMTEEGYPSVPAMHRAWQVLEADTIRHCARAVFTTPGAAAMYAQRYADVSASRFEVIENGYDEQIFDGVERQAPASSDDSCPERMLRLLHSGVIYPSERDPTAFFQALAELRDQGFPDAKRLRIVLRATGHDRYVEDLARRSRILDLVEILPSVSYREALAEMLSADALLLLQGQSCNRQIPAKLYEYLRSGKPVLGLASGDTAASLRGAGIDTVAALESKDAIKAAIQRFTRLLRSGGAPVATRASVEAHSRRHKTRQLAELLHAVAP